MKKQLLILITLCVSTIGFSQSVGDQFIDNFITYEITSLTPNTVMTRDYDFSGGGSEVIIPATVDYSNTTFDVTIIHTNSFNILNNELTKVVIPNSVVEIRSGAFFGNSFTSIVIPSSVTFIQSQAFAGNNALTCVVSEATTPPTIFTGGNSDTFGDLSFGTRSNINVVVPSGTSTTYANATWTGFQSLTEGLSVNDTFITDSITFRVTSTSPATVEVTDYDTTGGTIVNIPETVTASCSKVFTVTAIGNQAFQGNGLIDVTIPDSVTTIGVYAFFQNSITNVVLSNSITDIGLGVFENNNLTDVTIPNGVTNIGLGAFKNNDLTDITLPSSITSISNQAFRGNPLNNIISISAVPPSITTGGSNDSFSSNRSNINLVITNNSTEEYVTDSGALWTGFKMVFEATSPTTVEVSHYDPANGTNVVIPSTVTAGSNIFDVNRIDDSAFENIGLTSVIIPDSVIEIGISAFNTNNLTSVTISDSVTLIGTTAFATNSITNLSLGANVTDIGIGAFVDNNLSNVTIPSNVTFIGLLAFGNNPLASVTSLATTPPTITTGTNDTFAFDRSNIALHIPPGTMGAYVTDPGALWTGFNPVTEDALSIDEFELSNTVKIITQQSRLEIVTNEVLQLNRYEVYALTGAKIATGNTFNISTETWAKGIYILKLNFDRGTVVKKVIVK
ncbi:leucine-rich repeat protein [Winogradskyella algicola]|uniref:leucine-rich repeat protein n=1 Tax=Winogradskyella algicola TaxID=2575815 RepID=UPI0011097275|nr:leucine-rich repeat protein [Winogradskyella algicola]